MKLSRLKDLSLLLLGALAAILLTVAFMEYLLPVALPFLIAWFMAFATRYPAKRLSGLLHVSERVVRPILAILITLILFSLFSLFLWMIVDRLWQLLSYVGEGDNAIYDLLISFSDPDSELFDFVTPELRERIANALSGLFGSLLSGLASLVTDWVSVIPGLLLFLLATVISLIYFAVDLEKINARVRSFLPKRQRERLSKLREAFFVAIGKYMLSYLIMMLLTFGVLLFSFAILRIKDAFSLALLISVLDLLPIIGVGTVLVPWSIICFLTADPARGIALIVIFVLNTVLRELIEPRLVGKSLDMNPLLTLILIYAGYSLFGIRGIIALPVIAVIISIVINNRDPSEIQKPTAQ